MAACRQHDVLYILLLLSTELLISCGLCSNPWNSAVLLIGVVLLATPIGYLWLLSFEIAYGMVGVYHVMVEVWCSFVGCLLLRTGEAHGRG